MSHSWTAFEKAKKIATTLLEGNLIAAKDELRIRGIIQIILEEGGCEPPTGKPQKKAVTRVDRSPMNPMQWCLTLECGHEVWMTAKQKPTKTLVRCDMCEC